MQTTTTIPAVHLDQADNCTHCGEHASVHIRRGEILAPATFHHGELALTAPVAAVA
ncbi:hypothetical protein [Crossiella sp. CA198]|uniref:hypothetical protein n=1 Tax=Crossiella sp. CA198 TaxID=3455607 RepID=UPI003F8D776A